VEDEDAAKAGLLAGAAKRVERERSLAAKAPPPAPAPIIPESSFDQSPMDYEVDLKDLNLLSLSGNEKEQELLDFSAIDGDLERFSQDPVIRDALARGVDLRMYSKQVDSELRSMEALSIADYIRESDSIAGLFGHITSCEEVLTEMQTLLQGFQDNLGGISDEIKSLQDESLALDVKMKNRKALSAKLRALGAKFFVSENLIKRINEAPIDDSWLRDLRSLSEKIEYCSGTYRTAASRSALATHAPGLSKPELPAEELASSIALESLAELAVNPVDTPAGQMALPMIEMLRNKAVDRVRGFLRAGIDQVAKSSKTNVLRQQEHHLLKFAFAIAFLTEHGPNEAREIRKYYVDSLGGAYGEIFKKYSEELCKCTLPGPGKAETLGNFDAGFAATAAGTGGSTIAGGGSTNPLPGGAGGRWGSEAYSLSPEGRSTLLVEGTGVGCLDAPPLTIHLIQAEKLRVTWAGVFRSLDRHLLDVAGSEEGIVGKLFGEGTKEAKEVLAGVLKSAVTAVWEAVEAHCANSWDAPGLLLTLALASAHKRGHTGKGLKGMSSYSDRIGLLVWPRWKVVFDNHLGSLKALGAQLAKSSSSAMSGGGPPPASHAGKSSSLPPPEPGLVHPVTMRFAQFKASVIFLHRTALLGAGPPLEDATIPLQLCVFFLLLVAAIFSKSSLL